MLELSEKNYQEALLHIESLNEKNKQLTIEISNLKHRITKLGLGNAELMDLNHQYCEAIASFNSETGNAKSKNFVESSKIKRLEHELATAHKKLSELEKQVEKLNCKRLKELGERNYIEKRYEDIIYEQENALANIVLDNEKVYKESLIENLFEENNELSQRFNFTYNQAIDKIEIFYDEEKLFDFDNFDSSKPLKKFKSMNLIKCKNIDEIQEKTKNKIVSDFSFSYFESDESNDEIKNNKNNLFNDFNNASTKEPSRPSIPNSNNVPQMLNDNNNTDLLFKDINTVDFNYKKKNLSCEFNQEIKNCLKIFANTTNTENANLLGSFKPHSINDSSSNPNTLKSYVQNKSASFKIPNSCLVNHIKNNESSEFNNLEFTCAKRSKRKSLSSSSLNKLINDNCSQIKNDNSKYLSSFTNKDRELKKFYTSLNLKYKENEKTQTSLKKFNKFNNPVVTQFSLANSISDKISNLTNKSSNFKSKLSFALISRNKTEKLLSTMKNKLFKSDNTQNFILENLQLNQTIDNGANTDQMKILENNENNINNNNDINQNIDNPLFKSTNSSFINETSFNSKLIRRTTLDNYNIITSKLTSIANRNFEEIKKNKNNKSLIEKENEILETKSNNDSYSDADSYQKNIKNSNYFTLADKKFILEDLIEEDKCVKGFDDNDSQLENRSGKADLSNTSNINNLQNMNYFNQEDDQKGEKEKQIILENLNLFEQKMPIGRHFTLGSVENMKNDYVEIENSVNINIEGKSPNKDRNANYETKEPNISNRMHRKSLSNLILSKIDFSNFKAKYNCEFSDKNKQSDQNPNSEFKNEDSNTENNCATQNKKNFNDNFKIKESIFDKIRKDLILSSKNSNNSNKNVEIKQHACKNKGICHRHSKINKALNQNKNRHNFDSILLNTDFTKKSNLSLCFNPVKSFQEEEDENNTFKNKENDIKNSINILDFKSITAKFEKENLVNKIIRKSIANTSLKSEFLNGLKLSKQNNFNNIKEKLLNKEDVNHKRLSTNITTNNHYWKYTINLIPSQESSFNQKPNSHRIQNNKEQSNKIKDNNINKFKSSESSEHLNISIISDCNPAILDEINNENLDANGSKENKFSKKKYLNDLKNHKNVRDQKVFNDVMIDTQINNFCITSNAIDDANIHSNYKTRTKDYNQSNKYVKSKNKYKKRNEDEMNSSVCNKSSISGKEDSKNYICLKNKNKTLMNSPHKSREIISESEEDNEKYDYNNSYRSRENLLNNAYVREKYFSSSICQKNNNLNFKINLDLKILGNEGYL